VCIWPVKTTAAVLRLTIPVVYLAAHCGRTLEKIGWVKQKLKVIVVAVRCLHYLDQQACKL